MRSLSKQETELWCRLHEIALNNSGLPERSDASVRFDIPADTQKRVALVARGMEAFRHSPQILVWFDDWNVWPSGQRMHIFERFRMSYGETRRLIETPAHIFEEGDYEDAVSFVTLAVMFLWDCYVTTAKRSRLLFFSHDEYGLMKGLEFT